MGLRMGKLGQVIVWVLTIGMFFSTTLSCSISSVGNPLTEVTLKLQEESPKVDVSPGNSGIVTATGVLICEKWGPDQVKVTLTGNSTHGGASVIPPNMVFGGTSGAEETQPFSVTAKIPVGTSCSETPIITVSGMYVQGGMQNDIEPVSIEVIVMQYYYVNIYFDKENGGKYSAKYGESIDVEIIVHNDGNGKDRFEIDFVKREEWENDGFMLPDPEIISLQENRNESIHMTIGTPEDTYSTNSIRFQVSSLGSREDGGDVKYISAFLIRLEEHSVSDKIGDILLSPLAILLMIAVSLVVIVVWYRQRG